ncbi:MAG: metal ABC transporter ATP-binding protein [Candidatus Bathyarchaeia archaeon]|nr:metal ABC transporter ATP-binding protein [Candidatus Bathyarchaeota archaeon]
METIVDVKNLYVKYSTGTVALEDVSFTLEHPTFTAVIGPNGSGKTTLLRTILGLVKPTKGSVKVMGIDPSSQSFQIRRLAAYIPQRKSIDYNIPIKVKDVVLMGRLAKKAVPRIASRRDLDAAKKSLRLLGLEDCWDRPFPELSGGQQQRVLVARALASEARLMLLDEPLSGADVESQYVILDLLKDLRENSDVDILMVTHDLNPCHPYIDNAILLNRRLYGYGEPCNLMRLDILSKVYGPNVRLITHEGHIYAVIGDIHA